MNFIAIIILVAIGVDFILNLLADGLNLKQLQSELPQTFQGVYDADRYRKSQQYLKVNTQFGWVTSAFSLSLILVFWFAKGFPLLDQWVRSFELGPVLTGLVYMGILLLSKAILSLPFGLYATFVIEERFGFNTTTWKIYVMDLIKGLALALLLGTPLLAAILMFFQYAGANAWWYCWIGITLYMLGVQYIAPTWIMPLFNKFTPLEDGELKSAILSYANSIDFPSIRWMGRGDPQNQTHFLPVLANTNALSCLTH
jgi:STE24 endopeptidase